MVIRLGIWVTCSLLKNSGAAVSVQTKVSLKYSRLKLKKTLGDLAFHLRPLIYGTICPFTSVVGTILNTLNLKPLYYLLQTEKSESDACF